jgi:hypothetical protein
MYLKQLFFITSLLVISVTKIHCQINVFDNNNAIGNSCESYSPYIFSFMPAIYETFCFELPQAQSPALSQYTFDSEREIKAASHFEFTDSMTLTPETGGSLYAHIEPPSFEVVAYVNDLNNIPKLSKFELGINLPDTVLISIQNFLNETGNQELNPYMSENIYVQAVFKKIEYDTSYIEYDPFLPPEEVISVDSIIKKRDGFYTKEVERDISGFDDLYNHPLINNTTIVTPSEYPTLGGGWTVSESDYPFRVRFAPPKVGVWSCQIKISIQEGQQVYLSPTFSFNVVNSNKKGYLKVDNNQRFLKRDGVSFRPLGVNYPWPIREGLPLINDANGNELVYQPQYHSQLPPIAHYEQYLRRMDTLAMNGMNYFRLIMNPFSLDIEYEKLGDYTDRMHIAKEMDLIIERAEQNDMLIHWNFMLHNTLQTNGHSIKYWDWSEEPDPNDMNAIPTAGYCYTQIDGVDTPLDFFTNQEAKDYYKERLRYIIARWGYSPDIGMFEHFSEINQIGKKYNYDQNNTYVDGSGQYPGNETVFFDWHGEMSWYLKEQLDIPQLLTLSYTTDINVQVDQSFFHGNIDVITVNQYNYYKSDVHGFHRDIIPFLISNSGGNNDFEPGKVLWGNYDKPLFFSESGAQHLWGCDNFVETRRNIWQNMFWGVSGTLDWEHEILPKEFRNLDIYKRVDEFTQGVDLEGGDWHSGMVKLNNQGEWEYKESYRDDCIREDELADVVYLRSGDKEKAFGVITNRRANYYTLGEGECTADTIIAAPLHSKNGEQNFFGNYVWDKYSDSLQLYGDVLPEGGSNRLRLRNMKGGKEFKIKYYSPYDLVNSIKEETKWGPKLTLDFPEMDSLDIVLFEAFPMSGNFKSMHSDTTNSKEILTRESKKEKSDEVIVYPNPNDGKFVIIVEKANAAKTIYITDNLGKRIDSRFDVSKENLYNKTNFRPGLYFIEVVFEDRVIRRKIIIN